MGRGTTDRISGVIPRDPMETNLTRSNSTARMHVPNSLMNVVVRPDQILIVDRNDFTFRARDANRDCDWLDVRELRREEYCNSKGEDGRSDHKVKFYCQDTCRNFLSGCSNDNGNRCRDRSNYTFMTDNAGRQDCDWLSQRENRQDKWCNTRGSDGRSDRKVKYNCQESCSRYNDC